MLQLMELKRRAADIAPTAHEVLVNPHVVTKVEPHEEHGVDGPCIKIHSDEMPVMVCRGSVAELESQLRALDARGAEEIGSVLRPMLGPLEARVAALEAKPPCTPQPPWPPQQDEQKAPVLVSGTMRN